MPHVVVKLWPGKSDQQKTRLADAITKDVMDILHYGEESVSVAMEIKSQDWVETVYTPDIKANWDKLYKKAGYDETDLCARRYLQGHGRNRNEALRRYTHLVFPFRSGSIAGTDKWHESTDVLRNQDHAQRVPTAQERICRLFHRLSTSSGALSCGRSIAHKRRESYVRTRSAERMAYTPFRSNLDRDRRDGLGSGVGRTNRGDSKRGCYLDSTGSQTLARRNTNHGDDAHCNTGTTQWQSRGVDRESDRRAISQVTIAFTVNGRRSR